MDAKLPIGSLHRRRGADLNHQALMFRSSTRYVPTISVIQLESYTTQHAAIYVNHHNTDLLNVCFKTGAHLVLRAWFILQSLDCVLQPCEDSALALLSLLSRTI
jgi:hypothetical protein